MLPTTLFDGVEVDVISIGDADCIVVTQWHDSIPHRILIDGGCGGDAQGVKDFLLYRGYTYFWAVLCTHLHNDHATGLIKIVQDKSFTFSNGWMHDITKHVSAETLRRAAAAVDGVKDVVETTRELAAAFASRRSPAMGERFPGDGGRRWPPPIPAVCARDRSGFEPQLPVFLQLGADPADVTPDLAGTDCGGA